MDLTHGMHIFKLLLSRYLLNNLQLFRNVKVSVGTSQDVSPTLLVQLNFHEPLLTAGHLRCEVDMLENGCVKDFIKRMLNTKREYVIFCS